MSVSFVRSSERNNCDNCLFSLSKHKTVQIVFNNSGHVSGIVAITMFLFNPYLGEIIYNALEGIIQTIKTCCRIQCNEVC